MANEVEFDFKDFKTFFDRLKQSASGDFKKELETFMLALSTEFLRVVEDEIVRRKVMDTRLLLASFHEGGDGNVWEVSDGGLSLEVGTNVEYAAYVNDGHWTNPKGVERRFVPGTWEGERFIYDTATKESMVLQQKWVEGSHYFDSAVRIFEKMFPDILEAKIQQWLDSYFSEFVEGGNGYAGQRTRKRYEIHNRAVGKPRAVLLQRAAKFSCAGRLLSTA